MKKKQQRKSHFKFISWIIHKINSFLLNFNLKKLRISYVNRQECWLSPGSKILIWNHNFNRNSKWMQIFIERKKENCGKISKFNLIGADECHLLHYHIRPLRLKIVLFNGERFRVFSSFFFIFHMIIFNLLDLCSFKWNQMSEMCIKKYYIHEIMFDKMKKRN